jgi:Uma2 family endonuclease
MPVQTRATFEDLAQFDGKAELIGGRVVEYMSTGFRPSKIATLIQFRITEYMLQHRRGESLQDNTGYAVSELPSGRESFSPDASFYDGPLPFNDMKFVNGPPTFAVEVRSENDYGTQADAEYEAKREDYFQAGTLVVWDVDPLAQTITCYRAAAPHVPFVFRPGQLADSEPAMPGWTLDVAWLFAQLPPG